MHFYKSAQSLIILIALLSVGACSKKEVKPAVFEPKSAFVRATQLIEDEEFEEARELLTEIKHRDTLQKYAPLAQLKIADSFYREEEIELAVGEYRRFLRLYPENRYAPYAQYQIAMIYFGQIEAADRGYKAAEESMKEFKKLSELFPRNPYREIIPLRIQKCRNILAAHEHYVGEFYYKKGAYDAALGRLHTLLEVYHDYKRISEVYYLIARSYKELEQAERAEKYFLKTIENSTDAKIIKKAKKEFHSLKK